jgi:hypothetical protein
MQDSNKSIQMSNQNPSKMNRYNNSQKTKDKRTNNDIQTIHTRTHTKNQGWTQVLRKCKQFFLVNNPISGNRIVDRHVISVSQMTTDMFHLSKTLPGPFLIRNLSPGSSLSLRCYLVYTRRVCRCQMSNQNPSKMNRHNNCQKTKDKRTNNDIQTIHPFSCGIDGASHQFMGMSYDHYWRLLWLQCRTAIKALLLYFNLCLSVRRFW